jgi:hypothetical protein
MSDDAETRRRRAARLRQQIAELTVRQRGKPASDHDATTEVTESGGRRNPPRVRPVSPRSLIEERMRELDHDNKGGGSSS